MSFEFLADLSPPHNDALSVKSTFSWRHGYGSIPGSVLGYLRCASREPVLRHGQVNCREASRTVALTVNGKVPLENPSQTAAVRFLA